ncbi:MAG TPA: hypothetical protein DIW47_02990 [Bacteroidetes bacterium]|nr:hypothetical protein [Bacteroidota bacterium]
MFRISLFKLPQAKTFSHTPIYFDPEKEDLKRRVELGEKVENAVSQRISPGNLKESWGRSNRSAKSSRTSNLRVIMLIFILSFFAWFLLYY